jgi:hypothetical protein
MDNQTTVEDLPALRLAERYFKALVDLATREAAGREHQAFTEDDMVDLLSALKLTPGDMDLLGRVLLLAAGQVLFHAGFTAANAGFTAAKE